MVDPEILEAMQAVNGTARGYWAFSPRQAAVVAQRIRDEAVAELEVEQAHLRAALEMERTWGSGDVVQIASEVVAERDRLGATLEHERTWGSGDPSPLLQIVDVLEAAGLLDPEEHTGPGDVVQVVAEMEIEVRRLRALLDDMRADRDRERDLAMERGMELSQALAELDDVEAEVRRLRAVADALTDFLVLRSAAAVPPSDEQQGDMMRAWRRMLDLLDQLDVSAAEGSDRG